VLGIKAGIQEGTKPSPQAMPRRFRGTKVIDAPKPLLREINHVPQEQHRVVRVMREAILVRLYNVGRG